MNTEIKTRIINLLAEVDTLQQEHNTDSESCYDLFHKIEDLIDTIESL